MSINLVLTSTPCPIYYEEFKSLYINGGETYLINRYDEISRWDCYKNNSKIFYLGNYKNEVAYNEPDFQETIKSYEITEIIPHACFNCEFFVRVGNGIACNALCNIRDNAFEQNDCSEWEEKDYQAETERNNATTQQITHGKKKSVEQAVLENYEQQANFHELFNDRHPYLISREFINRRITAVIHDDMISASAEIPERPPRLNNTDEIINKIRIQTDYIINRFNVIPTQVLLDAESIYRLQHDADIAFKINQNSDGIMCWEDLEIVRTHSRNGNSIVEVLFLNQLV